MKNYLLFDLDGTLTDPKVGICTCVQYALEKGGYPVEAAENYYSWIGPPLHHSFSLCTGCDSAEADRLVAFYRERFAVTGERTVGGRAYRVERA